MLLLLPLPLGSKAEEGGVRTDDIYPPFDVVDDAGNGRCRGVNTTQQQQQEHHRKVRGGRIRVDCCGKGGGEEVSYDDERRPF